MIAKYFRDRAKCLKYRQALHCSIKIRGLQHFTDYFQFCMKTILIKIQHGYISIDSYSQIPWRVGADLDFIRKLQIGKSQYHDEFIISPVPTTVKMLFMVCGVEMKI